MLLIVFSLVLNLIKSLCFLYITKYYPLSVEDCSFVLLKSYMFNGVNSLFSDSILILVHISGLICLLLLGERRLVKFIPNVSIFLIFIVMTIILVYTTNLLVMFLSFEFIFLPTIYFAYTGGYTKKVDKAIKILFVWTLTGSFLVLCTLAYVYATYHSLEYGYLLKVDFSPNEMASISLMIFLGFGVKVPVFPFHFWLTKIHVEAPAGFSIFLSGFLVKAAVYCLFIFFNVFLTESVHNTVVVFAIIGIIESSCKM